MTFIEKFNSLPSHLQKQIEDYMELVILQNNQTAVLPEGVSLKEFNQKFAGCISKEEAAEMKAAIEELNHIEYDE